MFLVAGPKCGWRTKVEVRLPRQPIHEIDIQLKGERRSFLSIFFSPLLLQKRWQIHDCCRQRRHHQECDLTVPLLNAAWAVVKHPSRTTVRKENLLTATHSAGHDTKIASASSQGRHRPMTTQGQSVDCGAATHTRNDGRFLRGIGESYQRPTRYGVLNPKSREKLQDSGASMPFGRKAR
jgi:hypothetical protein